MKRATLVILIVLLVLVTAGATFAGTVHWMETQYEHAVPVLSKLQEVSDLIDRYYIGETDPEAMITAAADGAAAGLVEATGDRWSYYLSAEESAAYMEQLYNTYVGIGVTIREAEDGMEIVSVTAGGPAEEAGILPGDVCIAVEGRSTKELGMEATKELVRGEEGTTVQMTFLRNGEQLELNVERRSIVYDVATYTLLEEKIGLIHISNFDEHCAEQTMACIEQAMEDGAQSLIFDLRFNGGGLKKEMVAILDHLLPEGEIFREVDYEGREDVLYSDAAYLDLPMVVLVNEDSYSAAEFFAACLQEYGAAKIVGTPTTGKGRYQYNLTLSDNSVLVISSGEYFTPSGRSLAETGVQPDEQVDLSDEAYYLLYYGTLAHEEDPQLQTAVDLLSEKVS